MARRERDALLAAGAALLAARSWAAEPPITEIRLAGNEKTRAEILLRETSIHVGDPADPDAIERSRQAIMDLELFKSVKADARPGEAGTVVVFTVVEKHYLFVLPALGRNADGDISYGVHGRVDNISGRAHRLEAEAERTDLRSDAALDDAQQLRIHYQHQRFDDGPWGLDVDARDRRELLDTERDGAAGRYQRHIRGIALVGSRWKDAHGPSRGWKFGGGVSCQDLRFDFIEGDPTLYFDTTEVALLGRVLFRDVRNFEYNRAGRALEIDVDAFTKALGSAKDRLNVLVGWRSYNPLSRRRYTNLDFRIRAGMVTQSLYGDPPFDAGGADGVRGYRRGNIEGDAYILGNLEFLTPLGTYDALRGVVFVDAGDAFEGAGDASLAHIKTAAGLGLRWKIRSFVRLELRLDVARGFDGSHGGDTVAYAGTGTTF